MVRRVLELTDEEAEHLELLAGEWRVPVDELIHNAVGGLLRRPVTPAVPSDEQRARALSLSGRFHFGVADLAENHDRYLAEAFSHEDLR